MAPDPARDFRATDEPVALLTQLSPQKAVERPETGACHAEECFQRDFCYCRCGGEPVSASSSLTSNKGDRLDVRVTTAPDCSQQAWPYYDAGCIKDRGHKAPRVVTTDRVPLTVNR